MGRHPDGKFQPFIVNVWQSSSHFKMCSYNGKSQVTWLKGGAVTTGALQQCGCMEGACSIYSVGTRSERGWSVGAVLEIEALHSSHRNEPSAMKLNPRKKSKQQGGMPWILIGKITIVCSGLSAPSVPWGRKTCMSSWLLVVASRGTSWAGCCLKQLELLKKKSVFKIGGCLCGCSYSTCLPRDLGMCL